MKRLFIAIDIIPGQKLQQCYSKVRSELSDGKINWVKENVFHITLKFLGDTPQRSIPAIINTLKTAVSNTPAFDFKIESFGYFGNSRFPRVLWLGVEERAEFRLLHKTINESLMPMGYTAEHRVFKPHLTLGRVKELKNAHTLLELESEFAGEVLQSCHVSHIILYQSILKPSGPEYKVLEKFSLSFPNPQNP